MQLATLTDPTLRLLFDRMTAAPDEKSSLMPPNKKRRLDALSDVPMPAAAPYLQALLQQPGLRLGRSLDAPKAETTAINTGGRDLPAAQEKQAWSVKQHRHNGQVMPGKQDTSVLQATHERAVTQSLQARPLSEDTVGPVHNKMVAESPVSLPPPRAADLMGAQGTSGARSTLPSEKQGQQASTAILPIVTVTDLAAPLPSLTPDSSTPSVAPSRQLGLMPTPAPFAPNAALACESGSRRLTFTFRRADPTGARQVELLIPRQMSQPVTAMVSNREVLERLDVAIQQADAPPLALFEKHGQQRRAATYVVDDEEEA